MNPLRLFAAGLLAMGLGTPLSAFSQEESGPEPASANSSMPQPAGEGEGRGLRRDPFWPVGFVPADPVQAAAAADAEESIPQMAWPSLPVRGRSRAPDGTFRVLIDGIGIVGVNRKVSIQKNGYWFHWRVVHIDEEGVRLARLGISKTRTSTLTPVDAAPARKEKKP